MYEFNVFSLSEIAPTASAVAAGIKHGLLSPSAVCEYEEWAMNVGLSEGNGELLIFEGTADDALSSLRSAGYAVDGDGWRIFRCAVLGSLKSDGEQLLEEIERVYADFDYPEDMEPFIYYMPSDEDGPVGTEGMVRRFRLFLDKERESLVLQ